MTALVLIVAMGPTALGAEPTGALLACAGIGRLLRATVATLLFVPVVFKMAHGREHKRLQRPHGSECRSGARMMRMTRR